MRLVGALVLSVVMAGAVATPGEAAVKQLAAPKVLTASSSATNSIVVTFSTVPGAASYTVFLYGATGQNAQPYPNSLPGGTTISGLSTCTGYRVAVQAISSSRSVQSSVQSGKTSVTTKCNPALVPTFGTPTPTAEGFTAQITNFDAAFTWTGTVTAGSVLINGSGLATVTGLTTDASETLTVTTTRLAYDSGSGTVSGARSATPVIPSRWIGAGDFTVELWAKPTVQWAPPARQELFAIGLPGFAGRMDIAYTENGKWEVLAHPWVDPLRSVDMPPPLLGQWTHVALTRDAGTMRLYVAGQKVAESTATQDFSAYSQLILGADPNTWCHCYLANALLANVRVIDGTALYTGTTLAVPTSSLTAVAGTTFLLNNTLGDPTVGSVELDGTMRYQQDITIVSSAPELSPFTAYTWDGYTWQTTSVVTSPDSPFNVCGSNGLRSSGSLCQVGDVTAAGGTIFYASATTFTSTGSPCGTNCHYLEVAPAGWAPLAAIPDNTTDAGQTSTRSDPTVDPYLVWWARAWGDAPPPGTAAATGIGSGMFDTQELKTTALAVVPTPDLSTPATYAFQAALNYAGTGATATAGQWFLPSIGELNELCKHATGQTADLGVVTVGCAGGITGAHVPVLGFRSSEVYWSSSYPYMEGTPYPYPVEVSAKLGQTPGYVLKKPYSDPSANYAGYYSTYGNYVRPVRAS